jgi:hypothetical protein
MTTSFFALQESLLNDEMSLDQASQQATSCPGLFSMNGGSFTAHSATAIGQRGWNRHPLGGLIGLGTSPFRMIRWRLSRGFGMGMADINARV